MPPLEFNPMNEHVIKPQGDWDIDWQEVTGREMYRERSLTGLNRIPVGVHSSYVLSGFDRLSAPELPFSIDTLTQSLIIDGSIVILMSKDPNAPYEFQENLIEVLPYYVRQVVGYSDDGKVTRIYELKNDKWVVKDYVHYESKDLRRELKNGPDSIPKSQLFVYPNGVGILAPAQDTYNRLEEIERRVRRGTNRAIRMVIAGYTGLDDNKTSAALGDDGKDTLSIPSDVNVFTVTTNLVDQFKGDFETLLPLYFKQTNLVEVDDSSAMSGVARRLVMTPMLNYVEDLRDHIKQIYGSQPWNVEVEFDGIVTRTVEERKGELELLTELRNLGVIDNDEFNRRAMKLVV